MYDKELVSTTCKELSKLNNEKTNNTTRKWAKDMNKHLIKEDIQQQISTRKDAPMSTAIKKMYIKTKISHLLKLKKNNETPNANESMEEWNLPFIADENIKS